MESSPSYPRSPGYDKRKECWGSESKSAKQHKEKRGSEQDNGPLTSAEKMMSRDGHTQTKTPPTAALTNTLTPATATTPPPSTARAHLAHASSPKQTTKVASAVTATTTVTTGKVPVKHAAAITEGLTLFIQNAATAGTSEYRLKSPSSSRVGELKSTCKNTPKNLQKTTSASHLTPSGDLPSPKNLQKTASAVLITTSDSPKSIQRATQIPRATSSPKLRSNPSTSLAVDRPDTFRKGNGRDGFQSHSPKLRSNDQTVHKIAKSQQVQPPGTKHGKERSPQRHRDEETKPEERSREKNGVEDILQNNKLGEIFKGSDLTLQVETKCCLSPQDRKKLSPVTPSASQSKELSLKTDTNVLTFERECDIDRRKREERERAEQEKERLREKIREKREEEGLTVEQNKEVKQKEREKIRKDEDEKENEVRRKNEREVKENIGKECEKEKDMQRQCHKTESENKDREREENIASLIKSFKNAATMTIEVPVPVQKSDAGLQTDLGYVAIAVQASVEISSKSTSTSPTLTPRPCSQSVPNPESLLTNTETSETPCASLENGLSPDTASDPEWLTGSSSLTATQVGVKFLGPPPYKSPACYRHPRQHVCQIEIELRSPSSQSESLAPTQVTISETALSCHNRVASSGANDSKASPSLSGLENEPKQEERECVKDKTGPPPEVVWDEQGMTWEVYGAAVDMESLGFAIQSHLQRKIQEHERRIGTLRKSISLSEHSPSKGKAAKMKRNVFRSLFRGPACCSKTQAKDRVVQ